MAIVVVASICITLFVLYTGVLPYAGYISSTGNILISYFYVSSNFVSITIKNVGSLYISSVRVKVFQKDHIDNLLYIVLRYRIPSSTSVTFTCTREENVRYWSCSVTLPEESIKCISHGSICSADFLYTFKVDPSYPYVICVNVTFANKVEKVQCVTVVPVS